MTNEEKIKEIANAAQNSKLGIVLSAVSLENRYVKDIEKALITMAEWKDQQQKHLIEKVIWLIEDSYPDTVMWTHGELVENVTKDLESRARELNEMFVANELKEE